MKTIKYSFYLHNISNLTSIYVPPILINQKCCFCDNSNIKDFRMTSHLIPEGLGNKEIISKEECGICNSKYKTCDEALVDLLTPSKFFFGVSGKKQPLKSVYNSDFSFHFKNNIFTIKSLKKNPNFLDNTKDVFFDTSGNLHVAIETNTKISNTKIQTALLRIVWMLLSDSDLRQNNNIILNSINNSSFYKQITFFSLKNKMNVNYLPYFKILLNNNTLLGYEFYYLDILIRCEVDPNSNIFDDSLLKLNDFIETKKITKENFNTTTTNKSTFNHVWDMSKDISSISHIRLNTFILIDGSIIFKKNNKNLKTIKKTNLFLIHKNKDEQRWKIKSNLLNGDIVVKNNQSTFIHTFDIRNHKELRVYISIARYIKLYDNIDFEVVDTNNSSMIKSTISNYNFKSILIDFIKDEKLNIQICDTFWDSLFNKDSTISDDAIRILFLVLTVFFPSLKEIYKGQFNEIDLSDFLISPYQLDSTTKIGVSIIHNKIILLINDVNLVNRNPKIKFELTNQSKITLC